MNAKDRATGRLPRPLVLYSDPNRPFCYALGERLVRLDVDQMVEWCGVHHAPTLPILRRDQLARMDAVIDQEVRVVREWSPEITIRVISGRPNTGSAVRTIAAAMREDPTRGRRLRVDLCRALWQYDEDISNGAVLTDFARRLGFENLALEGDVEEEPVGWRAHGRRPAWA